MWSPKLHVTQRKKYKQKQTNKTLFSNHCFFLLLTTECHSCRMNHVNSRWFTNFVTAILHIPKQCTSDDPCHYWQVILLTACSWHIPPPPPIHCIGCDDLCQDIYQQQMYHLPPSNQQIVPPPPPHLNIPPNKQYWLWYSSSQPACNIIHLHRGWHIPPPPPHTHTHRHCTVHCRYKQEILPASVWNIPHPTAPRINPAHTHTCSWFPQSMSVPTTDLTQW